MRSLILALLLAAGPVGAAELEIEFRYHHDAGGNTENQSLEIEDGEIEIDSLEGERKERASEADYLALLALIEERLSAFEMTDGYPVARPSIEVKLEFKGEDRELEISEIYAAGELPSVYVELQERYFETVWR